MTLTTLILYITLAAILLTLYSHFVAGRTRNLLVSFLQNFVGAWFVFSGYVKVADPMGTAFKMEQYFAEFSGTAQGAGMEILVPFFTGISAVSIWVSMIMVVLEVVLGAMLILGTRPRFTSWAYLLIMLFFTVLTGFTYLTGYVPQSENFFAFDAWTAYEASNMRVTDCGCFGDFLLLEPYTSFIKDLFLLIPGVIFVMLSGEMHQLFSTSLRRGISWAVVVITSLFGMSNFVWGLPIHDFRPFAKGTNIRDKKAAEIEAASNIEITAYGITNKQTGEYVEIPFDEYMKRFKEFPSESFELKQITTEPAIRPTKVSEFELEDEGGLARGDELLNSTGTTFLIVAYKLYDEGTEIKDVKRQDSLFVYDPLPNGDTMKLFAGFREVVTPETVIRWNEAYLNKWTERVVPLARQARERGWEVVAATGFADPAYLRDFREASGIDFPLLRGDDIMLKTIIRSNPGVVILRDGEVVEKLHYRDLPNDISDLKF